MINQTYIECLLRTLLGVWSHELPGTRMVLGHRTEGGRVEGHWLSREWVIRWIVGEHEGSGIIYRVSTTQTNGAFVFPTN